MSYRANKGINQKGGGLTAPALTAKDMEDIKTAALIGIEYVAVSFPKTATRYRAWHARYCARPAATL